jgi:uncharacterized membrane-anchored protein
MNSLPASQEGRGAFALAAEKAAAGMLSFVMRASVIRMPVSGAVSRGMAVSFAILVVTAAVFAITVRG